MSILDQKPSSSIFLIDIFEYTVIANFLPPYICPSSISVRQDAVKYKLLVRSIKSTLNIIDCADEYQKCSPLSLYMNGITFICLHKRPYSCH